MTTVALRANNATLKRALGAFFVGAPRFGKNGAVVIKKNR